MDSTRRMVLVQGGVIGAGIIANSLSSIAALAALDTKPQRRSLRGLAWKDPIVATYRDAVGIMKQTPPTDKFKFNWVQLANIHGSNRGYRYCPHGNWYFLPWHRAYTAMYERIVRDLTKNDAFAMPFWDWTADPLMPEVFLSEKTPDGKTNWLYVNEDGTKRTWPANRPMPPDVVGPKVLTDILKDTPYEIFGTSRPRGQDLLDPSWIINRGGVQGLLERTPHNTVHNNIGGWMPTPASPRDPIFFMHHCNFDRIWAVWNLQFQNSKDRLWADMPFKDNFLNVDGSLWSPQVSDLYVPETLGYTYGLKPLVTAFAATAQPHLLALQNKLTTFFASPRLAGTASEGVTAISVDTTKTATPTDPLVVPIQVPEEALIAVAHRNPVGSGVEVMDFSAALEEAASGTRAKAFLRDVAVTDPRTTEFRVFIGRDNLNADTPVTDPHYVGMFSVLDHGEGGDGANGGHAAPSFVLDLTDAIQRVHGSGERPPGLIQLQLLPVLNEAAIGKAGTATPKRVEVIFVSV